MDTNMEQEFGNLVNKMRDDIQHRRERHSRSLALLNSNGWTPPCEECAAKAAEELWRQMYQRDAREAIDRQPIRKPIFGRIEVDLNDGEAPCFVTCPMMSEDCLASKEIDEKEAAYRIRCDRRDFEEWMKSVGIGERYWEATRDGIRENHDLICDYLDNLKENVADGRGLILSGPTGTGKSGVLALIAKQAESIGSCKYLTVTRLMRGLIDISRKQSNENDMQSYPRWKLLLLDEFGSAYEHDYVFAAFEDYIGWRYDNKLATCIATNLTPEGLKSAPNYARMLDRWRGTCLPVVMSGESLRKRGE